MNVLESQTEPLTRRVATGLGKIGLAIKSRAWKEAGVRRITPLQAQTLTILRMRPKSAATVSEIGEELAVALPTASEVLRVLEQRGLIKKQRSKTDARTVMVSLTTKGRRKADVAAGWPDFLAAAAEVLPPTEQESLLQNSRAMQFISQSTTATTSATRPATARHACRRRGHGAGTPAVASCTRRSSCSGVTGAATRAARVS